MRLSILPVGSRTALVGTIGPMRGAPRSRLFSRRVPPPEPDAFGYTSSPELRKLVSFRLSEARRNETLEPAVALWLRGSDGTKVAEMAVALELDQAEALAKVLGDAIATARARSIEP
jgi:hypothetical protein